MRIIEYCRVLDVCVCVYVYVRACVCLNGCKNNNMVHQAPLFTLYWCLTTFITHHVTRLCEQWGQFLFPLPHSLSSFSLFVLLPYFSLLNLCPQQTSILVKCKQVVYWKDRWREGWNSWRQLSCYFMVPEGMPPSGQTQTLQWHRAACLSGALQDITD